MTIVAFGSIMYVLGLLSCAILVVYIVRVLLPIYTTPDRMKVITENWQKHGERERMRTDTKMLIAQLGH